MNTKNVPMRHGKEKAGAVIVLAAFWVGRLSWIFLDFLLRSSDPCLGYSEHFCLCHCSVVSSAVQEYPSTLVYGVSLHDTSHDAALELSFVPMYSVHEKIVDFKSGLRERVTRPLDSGSLVFFARDFDISKDAKYHGRRIYLWRLSGTPTQRYSYCCVKISVMAMYGHSRQDPDPDRDRDGGEHILLGSA